MKLVKCKGDVIIDAPIKSGMLKLGFQTIDIFHSKNLNSIWKNEGILRINGNVILKNGVKINIGKYGELILGNNLLVNNNTSIVCNKKISIGENTLISWDCLVMDSDFHNIYDENNKIINEDKAVIISDKVWIGCRCTILKGSFISHNSIVAANTIVSKNLMKDGNVYGGNPVRSIKTNVKW